MNFGDEALLLSTLSKIDEEQKMIMAFIKKLSN